MAIAPIPWRSSVDTAEFTLLQFNYVLMCLLRFFHRQNDQTLSIKVAVFIVGKNKSGAA